MRPFFSVITVTKNTEKKINLTIKSVLSQNFKNFEYIVIDGYSKDNTFVNIKKYKDKRIKVFKYMDKGFYDGLNYGVQNSKGKYIAILNSGDIFYSNKILFLMKKKIIEFNKYQFFFSNLLYFDKDIKIKRIWKNPYFDNTLEDAFKIAHPTIFIKKEVAQRFKYNLIYKISSDLDFIIRLLKNKLDLNIVGSQFPFMNEIDGYFSLEISIISLELSNISPLFVFWGLMYNLINMSVGFIIQSSKFFNSSTMSKLSKSIPISSILYIINYPYLIL